MVGTHRRYVLAFQKNLSLYMVPLCLLGSELKSELKKIVENKPISWMMGIILRVGGLLLDKREILFNVSVVIICRVCWREYYRRRYSLRILKSRWRSFGWIRLRVNLRRRRWIGKVANKEFDVLTWWKANQGGISDIISDCYWSLCNP